MPCDLSDLYSYATCFVYTKIHSSKFEIPSPSISPVGSLGTVRERWVFFVGGMPPVARVQPLRQSLMLPVLLVTSLMIRESIGERSLGLEPAFLSTTASVSTAESGAAHPKAKGHVGVSALL